MSKNQPMRACDRCGKQRIVRHDRRNFCQECRQQGLRPIANWMEHGACRTPTFDPEWWWPNNSDPDSPGARIALNICAYCKVRDLCLDYAIKHNENEGIWGGLMPAGRRAITVNRRRRAV